MCSFRLHITKWNLDLEVIFISMNEICLPMNLKLHHSSTCHRKKPLTYIIYIIDILNDVKENKHFSLNL